MHASKFSELSVVVHAVSKGATGSRASEAANPQQKVLHAPESLPDSPKSTNEQVCFDDEEAELLPATKPMQFEGADCVHPTRPQEAVEAVPELEEDNDAEHEASSLAGSVSPRLCHKWHAQRCTHLSIVQIAHALLFWHALCYVLCCISISTC